MRRLTGFVALFAAGCGFEVVGITPITSPDASVDAIVDVPAPTRTRVGLIGLWTFDEASGATRVQDTSGAATPVVLKVITSASLAAPTFSGGTVSAISPARLISDPGNHLAADIRASGAVTFELWLRPASNSQGTTTAPRFVGGIASSISARDIALLQAGTGWLARVRTAGSMTDGSPDLVATTPPDSTTMTHIAVVADAAQRTLYVNGAAEATSPGGATSTWDPTYPLAFFDEPQRARPWLGELAMVAIYSRALNASEIAGHHDLGHNAD